MFILVVLILKWLLANSKEVAAWKQLFSKDRSKKLKKAREELKDLQEEAEFYDEALRQERFRIATGIHCSKKYRRICQKLVTDGIATVEGIRHAWTYIYEKNGRAEVKVSWIEWIMAALLIPIGVFGILVIFVSLNDIASLFDLSKSPNTLFILSTGVLFVFFSLQQLLPMIRALGISKRLKEKEREDALSSPPPAEEQSPSDQELITS